MITFMITFIAVLSTLIILCIIGALCCLIASLISNDFEENKWISIIIFSSFFVLTSAFIIILFWFTGRDEYSYKNRIEVIYNDKTKDTIEYVSKTNKLERAIFSDCLYYDDELGETKVLVFDVKRFKIISCEKQKKHIISAYEELTK